MKRTKAMTKVDTERSRGVRRAKAAKGKNGCQVCGWLPPKVGSLTLGALHGHHVVPVAKGGLLDETNVVVLCPNHHATAHAIGDVAWSSRRATSFGLRWAEHDRLIRWLKMADSDPAGLADDIATTKRRMLISQPTIPHPIEAARTA